MMTIKYQIEFFDFWHVSSGLASSTYADLLVNKNRDKLPYIPGRTLKGLLREAAEVIHEFNNELVTKNFIDDVFGQKPKKEDIEKENFTKESLCFFSNANISDYLRGYLQEDTKPWLYSILSSTKINENGLAEHGTLRQLEVTIPLTLYANIEQFPEMEGYDEQLSYCFQWIKRMGLNRSRGLGRCKFTSL